DADPEAARARLPSPRPSTPLASCPAPSHDEVRPLGALPGARAARPDLASPPVLPHRAPCSPARRNSSAAALSTARSCPRESLPPLATPAHLPEAQPATCSSKSLARAIADLRSETAPRHLAAPSPSLPAFAPPASSLGQQKREAHSASPRARLHPQPRSSEG